MKQQTKSKKNNYKLSGLHIKPASYFKSRIDIDDIIFYTIGYSLLLTLAVICVGFLIITIKYFIINIFGAF